MTGALRRLMLLLSREAPAQIDTVRRAVGESARTGLEHSVVGAADAPIGGSITRGIRDEVTPNASDRRQALRSNRPVLDFHTHPNDKLSSIFGPRPSSTDFNYWLDSYDRPEQELRTLIVSPGNMEQRSRAGYNFFATEDPSVFSNLSRMNAQYELNRAMNKGRFGPLESDPAMSEYLDYGGDTEELLSEMAPLMLLKHRAAQGRGRSEMVLGGRMLSPGFRVNEQRLMDLFTPTALEVFRERKLAKGGPVRAR